MVENDKDIFLEEIDKELKVLNRRLKEVMSEADTLLSEHFGQDDQGETPDNVQKEKENTQKNKTGFSSVAQAVTTISSTPQISAPSTTNVISGRGKPDGIDMKDSVLLKLIQGEDISF